jgi:NAD(P)H-flavin reductase
LAETTALAYTRAVLKEIVFETPDTASLTFELSDGRTAADFRPGQFNMLYVHGVGEVPISIASSRRETLLKHTLRAVGTVTRLLLRMQPGDDIGLRGPFGAGWPVERCYGRNLLIIAGGCGLPPLRPVVIDALAEREKFRSVKVLYGARTPKDLIYTSEYGGWGKVRGCNVYVTVDKADDQWPGSLDRDGHPTCLTGVGVVTTLLDKVGEIPKDTTSFVCGPEIMMKFAVLELLKRGVLSENIVVSLERNMNCGRGTCGHCQQGPVFICRDGPVFDYPRVKRFFVKEGV